jgi:hypothetical protein
MGMRGFATIIFVAMCWSCSALYAGAQDSGARLLLFSGTDLSRHGSFLHGGLLWSPDGLDREGFTLKALISGGTYDYLSGLIGAEIKGRELVARIMPGWRFKRGATEFKIYAGFDLQDHHLKPADPESNLQGGDVGIRAAFEFWTEPTTTTMIMVNGSASTIVSSYAIHAAAGVRLFDRFYVGPELQAFSSDGYLQRRIGVHVTSFKLNDLEWSAAAGYATDSDDRESAYMRVGVSRRY